MSDYEQRVLNFHNKLIDEKSVGDATGFSSYGQRQRFEVIAEYLPPYNPHREPQTLLDFGCGVGDLAVFLHERYGCAPMSYFGVEINPLILAEARRRHGDHFAATIPDRKFDWCVASGVLCYKAPGAYGHHLRIIHDLWNACTTGVIFNALVTGRAPRDRHMTYSPDQLMLFADFCECENYRVHERHYLDNDMTVVMRK